MVVAITPAQTIPGTVVGLFSALEGVFETVAVERLELTYAGIPGDKHAGATRLSGAREPWYPRGTEMRNERQLSILGEEDLVAVAAELAIDRLAAEWIGGNIVLAGIPHLSLLPARTILMFAGGASVRIDGDNGPCRSSGRSVASHFPERSDLEFGFVKAAKRRRGLVGWVEREGTITTGEAVTARVWEQWIYPPV